MPRLGACTADLSALAAWRRQGPLEPGVMEATGVYGMARCAGREKRGCAVQVVEAPQARQGPGRKTEGGTVHGGKRSTPLADCLRLRGPESDQTSGCGMGHLTPASA